MKCFSYYLSFSYDCGWTPPVFPLSQNQLFAPFSLFHRCPYSFPSLWWLIYVAFRLSAWFIKFVIASLFLTYNVMFMIYYRMLWLDTIAWREDLHFGFLALIMRALLLRFVSRSPFWILDIYLSPLVAHQVTQGNPNIIYFSFFELWEAFWNIFHVGYQVSHLLSSPLNIAINGYHSGLLVLPKSS